MPPRQFIGMFARDLTLLSQDAALALIYANNAHITHGPLELFRELIGHAPRLHASAGTASVMRIPRTPPRSKRVAE